MSQKYEVPCGRVLGHGEYCTEGYLCGGCKAVEDLEEWKRQALLVEASWDVQAVGRLINVPLGGDIRAAIQPALEKRQRKIAVLLDALNKLSTFDCATDEKIAIARDALRGGE